MIINNQKSATRHVIDWIEKIGCKKFFSISRVIAPFVMAYSVVPCVSAASLTSEQTIDVPFNQSIQTEILNDSVSLLDDSRFQQKLQSKIEQQTQQRERYLEYFDAAYAAYPQLPNGLLEAIAYANSRWSHDNTLVATLTKNTSAKIKGGGHHERPIAYGIMGLYFDSSNFRNVASEAASALKVDVKTVINDPYTNIMATAALLDQWREQQGLAAPSIESMKPLLVKLSGLPVQAQKASSQIGQYAQDSFVYDVMLALEQGIDDQGIKIKQRDVDWKKIFDQQTLLKMKAPFIKMDFDRDQIEVPGYQFDVQSESYIPEQKTNRSDGLIEAENKAKSTEYPLAYYVQSPYYSSRSGNSPSAVAIHTMEGTYYGTISWFQNNPYSVSAHYNIRSSDGQITQMVREGYAAHHVGYHNSYTLGIEHEGYINNPAYYTSAMYNSSANLVKYFCSKYSGINCASAYKGAASSGLNELPSSVKIKGHQHFSRNTHTDPGIYWNWASYYQRLNGGTGGGSNKNILLDSFETSEGHFTHTPAYSGSTKGISTNSSANRTNSVARNGNYAEQIKLVDDPNSNSDWSVRFLSGGGNPANNIQLAKSGGRIGFWIYTGGSGMSVAVSVDDSDGTERSVARAIPANQWTYVEWWLDQQLHWNPWVNGDGIITRSSVTLDAIWLYRAQTQYDVYVYIDDVKYRFEG